MKTLETKYVVAQSKEENDGYRLIIQTGSVHLVARIRTFSTQPKGEESRREFLSHMLNPLYFCKARGYRLYTCLYAALDPVSDEYINDHIDEVRDVLQEMADFYVEQLSEGSLRNIRDVPV